MTTLFDIFGSHESVTRQQQGKTDASRLRIKDQSNLKHTTKTGILEKRVLADVGNIQAKKTDGNASAKAVCEATTPQQTLPKPPSKIPKKILSDTKQKIFVQDGLSTISEDEDEDWPEIDHQGPGFWSDEDYEDIWVPDIWPTCERPKLEHFCQAAKICDEERDDYVMQLPSSPICVDFDLSIPPESPPDFSMFSSMISTDDLPKPVQVPWDLN